MNAKSLAAALLLCAWATSAAMGQTDFSYGREPAATTIAEGGTLPPGPPVQPMGTSRWITSTPCLCDSDGVSPPIGTELYLHSGVSLPIGMELLGGECRPGWVIGGGARTLFYNEFMNAAWVVDVGLSHIKNSAHHERQYPLLVIDFVGDTPQLVQYGTALRPGLFIRSTNRTFVNLSAGREWYLHGSADSHEWSFRWGVDGGGRYGTLSQTYDRIKHRTDVIGGAFGAFHGEFEFPCHWGMMHFGGRCEYSYTWSDILQTKSDIQEIIVLVEMGLRF